MCMKFAFLLLNLSYINLIISPAKELKGEEGNIFCPWSHTEFSVPFNLQND